MFIPPVATIIYGKSYIVHIGTLASRIGRHNHMSTTAEAIMPPLSAAQEAAYKRRWIALALLSLSLMIIVIDSTIVNIAFPSIRKTFNSSYADAEWVNSIYSLVFGAALITWGKLGDQYGRRSIFIGGAVVFVLGSLGTGLAPSI